MTILANALIGLSSLLTLLAGILVAEARVTSGPDTMGLIVVPLVLAPRWLALTGALSIAARRGLPDPPPGLAEPAVTAIAALPAWAERYLADPPRPAEESGDPAAAFPAEPAVDLSDMAQAAIVIADKYRARGLDFATPIRSFADTLGRYAKPESELGSDLTYQPRGYLDTWLEQQAARGTQGARNAGPR
jgi:hypothetical protein